MEKVKSLSFLNHNVNHPDYGGECSRIPLQFLHLEQLLTSCLSNHCLSKSLRIQVLHAHLSEHFHITRRPCCIGRRQIWPFVKFIQATLLQVAWSSEWGLPAATGWHSLWLFCWSVNIFLTIHGLQVPCINSCSGCPHLLLRQYRASHLEVGDWSWYQGKIIQTQIFKKIQIYSTALPAWLSAANHGIGVGGHWGRIDREV